MFVVWTYKVKWTIFFSLESTEWFFHHEVLWFPLSLLIVVIPLNVKVNLLYATNNNVMTMNSSVDDRYMYNKHIACSFVFYVVLTFRLEECG